MKKSTKRRIRKTVKTVTRGLGKAAAPLGGIEAALALGAIAAAAAFHPEVRARAKDLALAALDRMEGMIGGGDHARESRTLAGAH